ncbi:MAG: CoA-transferase [Pseudomonadota bacterium]
MVELLPSPDDLAARVPDGAMVAIAKEPLSPTALARALIRRGARDLHLVTVPTATYVADLLIGAGCVETVETSGVSLGEFGPAPRFSAAVKSGAVSIKDSTCPAVYAALQAGEKGQPFAPIRGLIGSDVFAKRDDYMTMPNPYDPADEVAILPALRPDIALIHADLADAHGNIWVGGRHELKMLAHAAHRTIATVEEVIDCDLRDDPAKAPNLIGSLYVDAVAPATGGAWPIAAPGRYSVDEDHLAAYARLAKDDAAFADYVRDQVFGAQSLEFRAAE